MRVVVWHKPRVSTLRPGTRDIGVPGTIEEALVVGGHLVVADEQHGHLGLVRESSSVKTNSAR